jgi:hypothetical protein
MYVTYLSVTFALPDLQARLGGFTGSPHKNTLAATVQNCTTHQRFGHDIAARRPHGGATTALNKSVFL